MSAPTTRRDQARDQARQAGAEVRRRLTKRRIFGLDRSGPEPPQTRAGAPLRPFTIPNLVGYIRLAAIPVFLIIAFESGDGRSFTAAAIFWLIAFGDYIDGLLARVTGQYSRLGALLDPIVDRTLVLSGTAVCWHFELLPRWALVALGAREIITLAGARIGLSRGVDIEISWIGRFAVFGVMSSLFFAMVTDSVAVNVFFFASLLSASIATGFYLKAALGGRHPDQASSPAAPGAE